MLFCACGICWGADTTKHAWDGKSGDGIWQTPGNWKAGDADGKWTNTRVVPAAGNIVYINTYDANGNINITLNDDVDLGTGIIYFECGTAVSTSITINLNGHSLKAENIVLGNPDSVKNQNINLNIVGPGELTAESDLTYKSSSSLSKVNVTDGATFNAGNFTNSGGASSKVNFSSDETSSIEGVSGSGVEVNPAASTWTGTIDTDWDTAGNWNHGVPTEVTVVTIPDNTKKPSKTGDIKVKSLDLKDGMTLSATGKIEVLETASLGGSVTSLGNQTYTGEVTLTADTTLNAGSNNIIFGNAVSGTNKLTATATEVVFSGDVEAGDISITGSLGTAWLGSVGVPAISCKNLTVSENAMFRGKVTASSVDVTNEVSIMDSSGVETSGTQLYGGDVLFQKAIELKATEVTFVKKVDVHPDSSSFDSSLKIIGNALFSDSIGSVKPLNSIEITGTTSIGGNVTVISTQKYVGDVTLTADVTLKTSQSDSTNINVTFGAKLNSDSDATPKNLTINCNKISCKSVGEDHPLKNLTVSGLLDQSETTSSAFNCTGEVIISKSASQTGTNLAVSTIRSDVQAASLTVSGGLAVFGHKSSSVTTSGNQTYDSVRINSESSNTHLFAGTIDEQTTITINGPLNVYDSDELKSVVFGSSSEKVIVVLKGDVGKVETRKVNDLTVNGTLTVGGTIRTYGNQTYNGLVTLSKNSSFVTEVDKTVTFGESGSSSVLDVKTYNITLTGNCKIYGENNFNTFSVDNSAFDAGSTSVSFESGKLQKIKNISAKGAEASKLTLGSTDSDAWKVYFTTKPTASNFLYTEISNCESVSNDGSSYNELEIIPAADKIVDADPTGPSAKAWFVRKYFWVGKTSTKWSEASNWAYDEDGNLASPIPSLDDGLCQIELKKIEGGKDIEFADEDATVPETITIKSLIVNEGNRLGLAGYKFKAVAPAAGAISNNGTIAVYGTQSAPVLVATGSGGTVVHADSSIIEYYGSGPAQDILYVSQTGTSPDYVNNYNHILLNMDDGAAITFYNEVNAKSINSNPKPGATAKSYTVNFEKALKLTDTSKDSVLGNYSGDTNKNNGIPYDVLTVNLKGNVTASVSDKLTFWGPLNILAEGLTISVNKYLNLNGFVDASGKGLILDCGNIQCRAGISAKSLEISCTELLIKPAKTASPDSTIDVEEFNQKTGTLTLVDENAKLKCSGKLSVAGETSNKGEIICSSGTGAGTGEETVFTGKYSGTGKLTVSSGKTTFKNILDLSSASDFVHNNGTVILERNGTESLKNKADGSTTFNNLEIGSTASNNSVSAANEFTLEGNLTVRKPFTASGVKVNGAASVLSTEKSFTVGNLTVDAGGELFCGTSTINVTGNFSNNGTFTAETSKVVFTGTEESVISGETSFYNLECKQAGKIIKFKAGKTQTVTNNFTVTGTAVSPTEDYSKHISLISDTDGSSWNIDCTGAAVDVQYAKVKDSNNVSKTTDPTPLDRYLDAKYSWDDGNNVKWNFPGMLYTWTGTEDSVWNNKKNWKPSSIPGADSRTKIPDVSDASNNFPELDAAVSVAQINIEENSWVDLNGKDFTISATDSDSYKNEGTVKTAGTETVVLPAAAGAVNENGVWEYYGGTVKAIENLSFNKIDVKDAVNISGTVQANEFKLSTTEAVTCVAASTIDSKVIIASSPTATGYSFDCAGYALTFNNSVETANDSGITYTLKLNDSSSAAGDPTGEISFKSAVSVKEIAADSKVKFDAVEISSEENQTYNKPVVLISTTGGALFKTGAADSSITFEDTVTGSGKNIEFASSDSSATDKTVVVKANVSGIDKFVSYFPVEFDTSTADFEVKTASGIVLHKDSKATGANKLIFSSKIDSGSNATRINFVSGKPEDPANETQLEFCGILGSVNPLATIKAYGPVTFNAAITGTEKSLVTTGNQYYYGQVTAEKNTILMAATDASPAAGAIQFANNVIGDGSLNVAADVYISAASEITAASFVVGGSAFEAATRNLHVSAGASAVAFKAPVTVNGNAIFYGGAISVQKNFSVAKDLLVLGANYNIDDAAADASGVTGLFAYNHSSRTAANGYAPVSYSDPFKTRNPDSTGIPAGDASSKFAATVSVAPGITITIGKNFYANGTTLSGTAAWNLLIPDNDVQTSAFAELYNSTIENCVVKGKTTAAKGWLSASENCTGSGNTQVDFSHPLIAEAYTVFDDVVFVRFVDSVTGNTKEIENSNNEINKAVSSIKNSAGSYWKAFKDSDCTQTVDGQGDLSQFYLRSGDGTEVEADKKWNTDANGISAGDAQSTDRNGAHRSAIPYLNLPKALSDLYASLRDSHKSRIAHYYSATPGLGAQNDGAGKTFTKVLDKTSPVLIQVKTGQEKHVAPGALQPEYDGHNFIEFTYSESVDIGGMTADKNVQATASLGGITNSSGGFTVASLASFASGKVLTGTEGTDDNVSVHSLYRFFSDSAASDSIQTHKIRLGIAGFVDNAAFSTTAGSINHWLGYIRAAEMPSGVVTRVANSLILDQSGNVLEHSDSGHSTNHALPVLNLNSSLPSPSGIYGAWDVSGPVFAPYNSKVTGLSDFCEAVGYTDNPSSPYLDRIEFHVVDSAVMLDQLKWFTKVGWASDENASVVVPAKDTAGGAKPFDSVVADRSAGGIRYSTIYDKVSHFTYSVVGGVSDRSFVDTTVGKTSSSLFISAAGGTLSVDDYDSLYFALKLSDSDLSLKTTFEISYDGNGYITDLAGNLMLPGVKTVIKSIDRVAPNFNISLASVKTDGGVSGDELYIVFSKALQLGRFQIKKTGSTEEMNGLEAIPKCLRIVEIDSSGTSVTVSSDLKIDDTTPAKLVFENKDYTGLILKLNRSVTLADMEKYFIQCYVADKSVDPVSGTDAYVTYVQDDLGNYMMQNAAHALTDFAVGVVTPVYAYDSSLVNSSVQQGQMYKDGSWAVHDWGRNQQNYGSLAYGYDIFLSTKLNDGSVDGVSELPSQIALYMAPLSKISGNALSNTVNKNTGSDWRMWMPDKTVGGSSSPVFDAISEACNSNFGMLALPVDSEEPSVLDFTFEELKFDPFIKNDVAVEGTDQVLFLFGLQKDESTPVTICHAPEYSESSGKYNMVQMPLFIARLENSYDLTSLDLWSLRLKDIISQRGNVTILNNVINASNGELTTVKVNMPSEGNLNVIVMTLDGNVVQYLQHGRASAGEHNYVWNGTTKSGKKVARGMYFVRVFGNGIDETRKVMVVKD